MNISRPRIVIGIVSATIFSSVALLLVVWPRVSYVQTQREIETALKQFAKDCPSDESIAFWETAVDRLVGAYNNVCYSESHVSPAELERFSKDLEERLSSGTLDRQTLIWVWRRLGKTGPHGANYVRTFEEEFDGLFLSRNG